MALTIPRAGTLAGAAPTIRVEPSDTGALVAEFGARLTEKAQGWMAEQRRVQETQLKLNIARDLGRAKQEVEQTGDPVAMGQNWDKRSGEVISQHITDDLDPQVRANLELYTQGLRDDLTLDLSRTQTSLTNSAREAQWVEFTASAITEASTADPSARAAILGLLDEGVDARVAAGLISPEDGAKEKLKLRGDEANARAILAIQSDPAAFLADTAKGKKSSYLDLGAENLAARTVQAQAEVARRAALAETEAKRVQTERIAAARDTVAEGIKVLRTGSPFAAIDDIEAIRADPVLAEALAPELTELANADALRRAMPAFAAAPLDAKRKMRDEMQAKPKDKAYQANVVDAMDKSIAEHEAALRDGRLYDYAATIGMAPVVPLPDPGTATDAEIAMALKARAVTAEGLANAGLTGTDRLGKPKPAQIFTAEEVGVYGPEVAPEASPQSKSRMAGIIAATPGIDPERAAAELGADNVFGYVGGGLAAGELTPKVATMVFEGQRAIAANEVAMPPTSERRTPFFRDMPRLFDDGTGDFGTDERAQMEATLATADAIYAYKMRGNADAAGIIDETVYKQSLHEAFGGQGQFGSSNARGGLAKLQSAAGDYHLPLPKGVSGDEVQEAFDTMADRLYLAAPVRAAGVKADTALGDDVWKRLSITGNAPSIDGKPLDGATWRRLELRPVGGDAYELILPGASLGSYEPVGATGGKPYILSLTKFLQFTGQGQ